MQLLAMNIKHSVKKEKKVHSFVKLSCKFTKNSSKESNPYLKRISTRTETILMSFKLFGS